MRSMESSSRHGGCGSMSKQSWFPPLTFQLRVRSLSSLSLLQPPNGSIQLQIRSMEGQSILWASPWQTVERNASVLRVEIPDNAISHPFISFSVIVLSSSSPQSHLWEWKIAQLQDLKAMTSNALPEKCSEETSLLVGIRGGAVFLVQADKEEQSKPRVLQFQAPYQTSSYSLSLLLKYRRNHRALQQRETDNHNLKQELADQGLDMNNPRIQDVSSLSLHQRIFTSNPSKKSPFERKSELLISSKIEYLRVQLDLLRSEKRRLQNRKDSMERDISSLSLDIRRKKEGIERLTQDTESLKASLITWSNECQTSLNDYQTLDNFIKQTRLRLVNSVHDLFPISIEGNIPTLRWVSLPNLSSLSRPFLKQDTLNVVSIVIGWIAHIVVLMSRCLDIPLRYPIKVSGPVFSIRNDVCKIQEDDLREFPLTARSVDLNRCEYGIYLLNKNVCYLRWSCGLPPGDVRKILHNVLDLYNLGLKQSLKSLKKQELERLAKQSVLRPPWLVPKKLNNNNNFNGHSTVSRDS